MDEFKNEEINENIDKLDSTEVENFDQVEEPIEDDVDIEIILNWTTGREQFYLFSNGGENEDGGTPITGIKTALTNFFKKKVKDETNRRVLVRL